MLLKEHKDLKLAIVAIPSKEKDKLLLRLIAKDKVLTEHLHFKLLEDESALTDRFESLKLEIENAAEYITKDRYSAKDTLVVMRKLNGKINHHYKVTKDINTEVELRMCLLLEMPLLFKESVLSAAYAHVGKLATYFVRTTISALNKYRKLHEDLQFDLGVQFSELLKKIDESKPVSRIARELGLPKEL